MKYRIRMKLVPALMDSFQVQFDFDSVRFYSPVFENLAGLKKIRRETNDAFEELEQKFQSPAQAGRR